MVRFFVVIFSFAEHSAQVDVDVIRLMPKPFIAQGRRCRGEVTIMLEKRIDREWRIGTLRLKRRRVGRENEEDTVLERRGSSMRLTGPRPMLIPVGQLGSRFPPMLFKQCDNVAIFVVLVTRAAYRRSTEMFHANGSARDSVRSTPKPPREAQCRWEGVSIGSDVNSPWRSSYPVLGRTEE